MPTSYKHDSSNSITFKPHSYKNRNSPKNRKYQNLLSLQKAELVSKITEQFAEKFLADDEALSTKMSAAAKVAQSNLADRLEVGMESEVAEEMACEAARTKLKELLNEYENFLREKNFKIWEKTSKEAIEARKLCNHGTKNHQEFQDILAKSSAESFVNLAICLVFQTITSATLFVIKEESGKESAPENKKSHGSGDGERRNNNFQKKSLGSWNKKNDGFGDKKPEGGWEKRADNYFGKKPRGNWSNQKDAFGDRKSGGNWDRKEGGFNGKKPERAWEKRGENFGGDERKRRENNDGAGEFFPTRKRSYGLNSEERRNNSFQKKPGSSWSARPEGTWNKTSNNFGSNDLGRSERKNGGKEFREFAPAKNKPYKSSEGFGRKTSFPKKSGGVRNNSKNSFGRDGKNR
jgi:hypothetical protein